MTDIEWDIIPPKTSPAMNTTHYTYDYEPKVAATVVSLMWNLEKQPVILYGRLRDQRW